MSPLSPVPFGPPLEAYQPHAAHYVTLRAECDVGSVYREHLPRGTSWLTTPLSRMRLLRRPRCCPSRDRQRLRSGN